MNCPKCGSENVDWVELAAMKTGDVYKKGYCHGCGRFLWVTLAERVAGPNDEEDIN